jgi:hypothetical protein
MNSEVYWQQAQKWADEIAQAYADRANPSLAPDLQAALASRLADKLNVAIVIAVSGSDWDSYVNNALDEWERITGGQGPRLISVDEAAGTVKMTEP